MDKKEIIRFIDNEAAAEIIDVSHKIWEFAELSLKETESAALYVKKLKEHGFEVETGQVNIDTAFTGKYVSGSGKPVIGILGEFDALSGLSQKAGITHYEELVPGGSGHGCGHNMLGAGAYGAALAIKKILKRQEATVRSFSLAARVRRAAHQRLSWPARACGRTLTARSPGIPLERIKYLPAPAIHASRYCISSKALHLMRLLIRRTEGLRSMRSNS